MKPLVQTPLDTIRQQEEELKAKDLKLQQLEEEQLAAHEAIAITYEEMLAENEKLREDTLAAFEAIAEIYEMNERSE